MKKSIIFFLIVASMSCTSVNKAESNRYEWIIPEDFDIYQEFVNYMFELDYLDDIEDEWQTPEETYIRGGGDCEDLSLLAAHILIQRFKQTEILLCYGRNHLWVWWDGYFFECTYVREGSEIRTGAFYQVSINESPYSGLEWIVEYKDFLLMAKER